MWGVGLRVWGLGCGYLVSLLLGVFGSRSSGMVFLVLRALLVMWFRVQGCGARKWGLAVCVEGKLLCLVSYRVTGVLRVEG